MDGIDGLQVCLLQSENFTKSVIFVKHGLFISTKFSKIFFKLSRMTKNEFLCNWPPFVGEIGWENLQWLTNKANQERQVISHVITATL